MGLLVGTEAAGRSHLEEIRVFGVGRDRSTGAQEEVEDASPAQDQVRHGMRMNIRGQLQRGVIEIQSSVYNASVRISARGEEQCHTPHA